MSTTNARVDKIARWLDISPHLVHCGLFDFSGKIKLKNKHRRNILDITRSAILSPSTFSLKKRELKKFKYFLWSVNGGAREAIREMVLFFVSQQPCLERLLLERHGDHWKNFEIEGRQKLPILNKWMGVAISNAPSNTEKLKQDVRYAYDMKQANHEDLDIIRNGFVLREIRAPHHLYVTSVQSFACLDCKKIKVKYIYNDETNSYLCPKNATHRLAPVYYSGNIIEFYGKIFVSCIRCGGEFVTRKHFTMCNDCINSINNTPKSEVSCDVCGIMRKKNSKKKWQSIKIFNHPNYLKTRAILCHLECNIKHKDAWWSWPILLQQLKDSAR